MNFWTVTPVVEQKLHKPETGSSSVPLRPPASSPPGLMAINLRPWQPFKANQTPDLIPKIFFCPLFTRSFNAFCFSLLELDWRSWHQTVIKTYCNRSATDTCSYIELFILKDGLYHRVQSKALHVHPIHSMKGLISLKSHVSTSTLYSPVHE